MRRRTVNELKEIVKNLGYLFLEDNQKRGKGGEKKVIIQDKIGYKYDILLHHLMDKTRNIDPFNKGNPYTLENISLWTVINKKPFKLCSNNIYNGNDKLLNFHCFKCDNDFVCNWGNISQGQGCGVCKGNQLVETKTFGVLYPKHVLYWSKENTFPPTDIGKSYKKKVKWECYICGNKWENTVENEVRKNNNCLACSGRKGASDKNRLSIHYPIIVLDWNYDKNKNFFPENVSFTLSKKVWWKCHVCKYEWKTSISKRTQRGDGCSACLGRILTDKNRLSILLPKLCEEWDKIKNGDLKPENFSFGMNDKIWWICSICKHSWKTSINSRAGIHKTGCKFCADTSKGNTRVKEFLLNNSIKFIPEYRIDQCRNILALPFDFYLTDYKILIEYDGLIHFKDVFNDPENFAKVQLRDGIKTKFCLDNNILLIRIKYTKFNKIEEILTKELNL